MSSKRRGMAGPPPLAIAEIPEFCLGVASRTASRAANRVYAAYLAAIDLQPTQFPILVMIALHGGDGIAALAARLELEASAMTRNVQHLERRGLVAAEGGRGRGGKRLRLTAAGQCLLDQAAERWSAAHRALLAEIGSRDARALRGLLRRLEDAALRLEQKATAP